MADSKAKPLSLYHLYIEDEEGALTPVGEFEARSAEGAVQGHLEEVDGEHNGRPFVIVPDRNLTRVEVEIETVKKVRLRSA